ncbi:hypothetical protein cypCar_00016436 [Cyprinus carpio]|nr:hypothetical protein cypCar_00016436 [Cyprinus carpio]
MKKEIAAVVFFLKRLIKKAEKLNGEKVDLFVERLTVALQEKYKGHWYPDNPSKGQAFRCIRVNRFHKEDTELLRACAESGVQYKDLGLPKELTLWVDPGEVCCSLYMPVPQYGILYQGRSLARGKGITLSGHTT